MLKQIGFIILLIGCIHWVDAQNLNQNLLIHYPFDGNTNDVSGNGYDGNGNAELVADRFGNANSAYHFNGVDQSINLPNAPALKPQLPVSISVWVKFENFIQSNNNIITTDFTNNRYFGVWLNTDGTGRPAINYGDGDPNSTSGPSRRSKIGDIQLEIGVWYMITGVVRGPTDMDLYVNCENVGGIYDGSGSVLSYSTNPGVIGKGDVLGSLPYYFRGTLDEIYYWDREITQEDVTALIDTGYSQTFYETICQGDTFYYNNVPYFESGIYPIVAPVLGNCLSTVILDLSVSTTCECRFKNDFSDGQTIDIVGNGDYGIINTDNDELQIFALENGPTSTSASINLFPDAEASDTFVWSFELNPEFSVLQSRVFIALSDSNATIANDLSGFIATPTVQDAVAVVVQPEAVNSVNVSLMVKDENKAFIYSNTTSPISSVISNNLIIPNSPLSLNNNTNYYLSVIKFDELTYQLNVFLDSAKTQHIANSPICLFLNETENPVVDGLNYFQVANNIQSNSSGNFQGVIDQVCVGSLNMDFEITGTDSACAGAEVTYTISSQNGANGIVTWNYPLNAELISSSADSIVLILGDSPGTITANINWGCFSTQVSKNVSLIAQLPAQISGNTSVCPEDSTILTLVGNYDSILWNSIQTNSASYTTGVGLVFIEAINSSGCLVRDSVLVESLPISAIELSTSSISCNNDSVLVVANGNFSSFLWNSSISGSSSFYAAPGQLTVQNAPGTGCFSADTLFIPSTIVEADFSVLPDSIVQLGTGFNFSDLSSSLNSEVSTWLWDFGFNSAESTIQNPSFTYPDTGSYLVTLSVTTLNGCEANISSYVHVVNGITIPNAFSPNGDGINDFFEIDLQGLPATMKLLIYDRWGKLLYEDADYKNNWDGGISSDGVYFYVVEIENEGIFKGYLYKIDE